MHKRLVILLSLIALPALALWLRAADPAGDPARAAFQRGNALLRDARQACAWHEPDLLRQAAGQYRDCLASPTNTLDAGSLVGAARHNLELTKLLLVQATPPEQARGAGDQETGAGEAVKENGARKNGLGDQPPSADRKDFPTKADAPNAKDKEGAPAKSDAAKDEAGWNNRPRRAAAAQAAQAEQPKPPEPHPFDSQCPT
jgi:hypothetical protein